MLSLEEQIIDATTEEGQAALKEFEEKERATATEAATLSDKYADDPEWPNNLFQQSDSGIEILFYGLTVVVITALMIFTHRTHGTKRN